MIERTGITYALSCDMCGFVETDFEEFQEAVNYKKAKGWRSINVGGVWQDSCADCVCKGVNQ